MGRPESLTCRVERPGPASVPPALKGQALANGAVPRRLALESDPVFEPDPTDKDQRTLGEQRSDLVAAIESANNDGRHKEVEELRGATLGADQEIAAKGIRETFRAEAKRRVRSTRRRSDVVDLPKRKIAKTTVGRAFTSPDGQVFRPSLFVTVTLDSYGRVLADGSPINPAEYDYKRAAKDAIHFSKAIDRLVQKTCGELQAFRFNTLALLNRNDAWPCTFTWPFAAPFHARKSSRSSTPPTTRWWPSTEQIEYPNDRLPVGRYLGDLCRPGNRVRPADLG